MDHWAIGALVGLSGGIAIAFLNYALSRVVIRKKPSVYASFSVVRQFIHILYLVILYLIAPLTPWGRVELLVGGVLGITVPMFALTASLMRETERSARCMSGTENSGKAQPEETESIAGSPQSAVPSGEETLCASGQNGSCQVSREDEEKQKRESEVSNRG